MQPQSSGEAYGMKPQSQHRSLHPGGFTETPLSRVCVCPPLYQCRWSLANPGRELGASQTPAAGTGWARHGLGSQSLV